MEVEIHHDTGSQEFTVTLDQDQAELSYAKPQDKVIDFQHTFVPRTFRGKGLANKLIEAGLEYARQQQCQVLASCPVVSAFIRRHQHYQDLLYHPK